MGADNKQPQTRWANILCCYCVSRRLSFSTSGFGSSESVLLGYIFWAMMMRTSRSEVERLLALRLEEADGDFDQAFLNDYKWSLFGDFEVKKSVEWTRGVIGDIRTWSRTPAAWYGPGWRRASPPLPLARHCCWAAEPNGAPGTRCTAHTAWGGSASPRPERGRGSRR